MNDEINTLLPTQTEVLLGWLSLGNTFPESLYLRRARSLRLHALPFTGVPKLKILKTLGTLIGNK